MRFVDYENHRKQATGEVHFTSTTPARFSLRPAPRIVFGTPPAEFAAWYYGDRGVQESGLLSVHEATLIGTDVVARDGVGINIPQCGIDHGADSVSLEQRIASAGLSRKVLSGARVVLPGAAFSMYGHWLVDFLPRLFNLIKAGLRLEDLTFLLPASLPKVNRQWLTLLGVPPQHIEVFDAAREYCHVETALIPLGLRGNSRAQPLFGEAAAWMRRCVLQERPQRGSGRKLFVTRRNWGNESRILRNEDELSTCAARSQFEIISPEMLSILDQVTLFSEASFIVGDYGSAMHNSIFAPPQSFILAMRGRFGHPGFLQSGLCEALEQDCGYIFGETDGSETCQRYDVDLGDFQRCLDLVLSLGRHRL